MVSSIWAILDDTAGVDIAISRTETPFKLRGRRDPPAATAAMEYTTIDCSGWLAQPPPSSAGEPSGAPPGYDPNKMAGNTPEGIRHLMHHRPEELYKATKRLVELSHDKLGFQQGHRRRRR